MTLLILLLLLDHDAFRVREAAHRQLSKWACHLYSGLVEYRGSPEATERCRAMSRGVWHGLSPGEKQAYIAAMRPKGWKVLPWLSSLPEWNHYYLDQATANGYSIARPDYTAYRKATEYWLLDLAKVGFTTERIQELLDYMAASDISWCTENGVTIPNVWR